MSHTPLSAGPTLPFTPQALGTFHPATEDQPARYAPHPTIQFFLRVPNWEDRDLMALRMYAMGVRDVTGDQIQNLIMSELWTMFDEDTADEHARFLDGFWTRQQQYQRDLADWGEQEALRRSDQIESGKPFEPEVPPAEVTTPRERAKVNLIVAEVTDGSRKLRDKLADQQLYQTRYRSTIVRLGLAGWSGLETPAAWDPRPALDAASLTKETIEGLRGELMNLDETGAAWNELCAEAEAMYDLPRSAEKNSSSPPESSSPRAGSTTRSSDPASSSGASTSPEATSAPEA